VSNVGDEMVLKGRSRGPVSGEDCDHDEEVSRREEGLYETRLFIVVYDHDGKELLLFTGRRITIPFFFFFFFFLTFRAFFMFVHIALLCTTMFYSTRGSPFISLTLKNEANPGTGSAVETRRQLSTLTPPIHHSRRTIPGAHDIKLTISKMAGVLVLFR
jgi:hypothetical protein